MTKDCASPANVAKRLAEAKAGIEIDPAQEALNFAMQHGYHGCVILSPICPDCGALHDWRIITNIGDQPQGDEDPDEIEALMENRRKAAIGLLEDRLQTLRNATGVMMQQGTKQ